VPLSAFIQVRELSNSSANSQIDAAVQLLLHLAPIEIEDN
jgi:hypothetical protein